MSDFELWIYRGSIVILLAVLWYLAKQVLTQLKEMNLNIKSLAEKGIMHDGKLEMVQAQGIELVKKVDDHENRIRDVERKQDQCQYCDA